MVSTYIADIFQFIQNPRQNKNFLAVALDKWEKFFSLAFSHEDPFQGPSFWQESQVQISAFLELKAWMGTNLQSLATWAYIHVKYPYVLLSSLFLSYT